MNILIIGATSGIGKALYAHYISRGDKVAIMGRRKEILNELHSCNPSETVPLPVDISDCAAFNGTFSQAIASLKQLDLAILCAGIGDLNPRLEISQELAVLSTNVTGWTNAIDTLYRYFETRGKGHIVSITSVGGLQSTPLAPSYSASKAFQINYTKSLQAKAKRSGLCVTKIRPGLVDTRMAKGEGLFWVMPVEKVTKQIVNAIEKKKTLCVVTRRWRLLNFLLKHFI
ncbi:MAG: SDR family NAD(P)-dependent oxidoreductase [Bacteroidaceae bacterium]|nr:SDR family NAD(P)-dependent oxidoreductase [Bacteroidaceae bacterium]